MGDEGEFSQSILDILYATEVLCEECSNDDVSTDGDIVAIVGNELSCLDNPLSCGVPLCPLDSLSTNTKYFITDKILSKFDKLYLQDT